MIYKVIFTDGGVPKAGLTPAWHSLIDLAGNDKSGSAPTIVEVGNGIYKFEVVYGTAPFNVNELVGWIDGGSSLENHERYLFVTISIRDLALARQVNKATHDLANRITAIRNDADTADELTLSFEQAAGIETRTPS